MGLQSLHLRTVASTQQVFNSCLFNELINGTPQSPKPVLVSSQKEEHSFEVQIAFPLYKHRPPTVGHDVKYVFYTSSKAF